MNPADLDIELIHGFLSERSTWARGISKAMVQESIEHSLNFAVLIGTQQVGFARVVTDQTTFAYLLDVFVIESHRGRGLSRLLMAAVMAHPKIARVRRFVLVSSTARGLYSQFGFQPPEKPETFMEINVSNAYGKA